MNNNVRKAIYIILPLIMVTFSMVLIVGIFAATKTSLNVDLYMGYEAPYVLTVNAHSASPSAGCTYSVSPSGGYAVEGTVATFTATVDTGYSFLGWYKSGSSTALSTETTYTINSLSEDTAIYAKWEAITYTITYELDNGTNSGSNPSTFVVSDLPITLASPTRTGYDFTSWQTGTGPQATTITQITSIGNITVKAKWTGKTYTVTFDKQDGTGGSDSVTATYGAAMPAATAPTKTGYKFGGYYTGTGGSGTQYYNDKAKSARKWDLTQNTTLYAKWTASTYTVTLDMQSGSGGTSTVTATYTSAMPSATAPTRSGYNFAGYYSGTGGTGTQYYTSSMASAHSWDVASNTTIYAYWIEIVYYTVTKTSGSTYGFSESNGTYSSDNTGVSSSTASVTVTFTGSCTIYLAWTVSSESSYDKFTIKNGSTTLVNAVSGTNNATLEIDVTSSTTLTIYYTKDGSVNSGDDEGTFTITGAEDNTPDIVYYTVSASRHGSSPSSGCSYSVSPSGSVASETSVTFTASVSSGYSFQGWYSSSSYTSSTYRLTTSTSYTTSISSNTTYYAYWTQDTVYYSVSAGKHSSSPSSGCSYSASSSTVASGSSVTFSASMSSGYTFQGWYSSSSSTSSSYLVSSSSSYSTYIYSDTTYYAYWTQDASTTYYTVSTGKHSSSASSGCSYSVSPSGSVASGTSVTFTASVSSGYTFKGWWSSSSSTSTTYRVSSSTSYTKEISSNTTYYAYWISDSSSSTTYYVYAGADPSSPSSGCSYSVSPSGNVSAGTTVTFSASTSSGYTFKGWYDSSYSNMVSSSSSYSTTVNSDLYLYAYWTQDSSSGGGGTTTTYYSVSADVSGYTTSVYAEVSSSSVTSGTSVEFTTYYTGSGNVQFNGWYSGSTLVSSSQSYTKTIYSDTSLTAKWTRIS